MTKKRKRTSLGGYVQHLDPASSSSSPSKQLNLSAYHPDLDLESFPLAAQQLYHSLLPSCLVHPSQFPPKLLKYWRHRHTLFSLYSSGCLLDEQSWYSITPESVAFRIAKRCASDGVVVDLFAGAGGNAIQFAMTCGKVIAVELDEVKLRLAMWNAAVYGVRDRIVFVQGDSVELLERLKVWREARKGKESEEHAEDDVWKGIKASELDAVQAVFLSPPWGGVDYAQPANSSDTTQIADTASSTPNYHLSSIQPIDGAQLFSRVQQAFNTNNIAYYLPRNTSLPELSSLARFLDQDSTASSSSGSSSDSCKSVKIEYQYVNYGTKLSSLTAFYGALAHDWDDDKDDWRKT